MYTMKNIQKKKILKVVIEKSSQTCRIKRNQNKVLNVFVILYL